MFGVIASGRLVQTNFQQVDETKFVIDIPDADNINHVVIFLTGVLPLPNGSAGAVYFSWPDPSAPPNWQYLGYISNTKPSAIFKISRLKKLHEMKSTGGLNVFGSQPISHTAQIGVSLDVEQHVSEMVSSAPSESNCLLFAQKILENFFNFASSFAMTQTQKFSNPSELFVPLSTLQTWYTNFQRRLEQNPNFWKL